jgi:two-component system NarL family sensor kinase
VRRLVYDLRPPALDQLGLVGALRAHAAGLPGGLDISIDAPDLGELPAAVEVAAYRIVGEAITNAARHAGGSSCSVRLRAGEQLEIEIRDDGRGIGLADSPGVGLASMRERAGELEGNLQISSPPEGGTLIRARLPLEAIE